ncbi:MAG: hypothetical protein EOO48_08390, partial [Flavobacterium sp.]
MLISLYCGKVWSALPDFSLTVSAANETCTANGSLAFSVSGTDPAASVTYSIYHLPDTATPVATLSGNTYGGLVAGNYRVIATQTLGSESNVQQHDVAILYDIVTLTFSVSGQNVVCGNDGRITVLVGQGMAVNYEIFSGPVTRPLQSSPVFDLLPAGTYQIRGFDSCGEGVVQNFILLSSPPGLTISSGAPAGNVLPACDSVKMVNSLSATANHLIAYPLTLEYTVHPPSGPPIGISQTVLSGSPQSSNVSQIIPLYYDQPYTYDLKVTDACGNSYTRNAIAVNVHLTVTLQQIPVSCNSKKLTVVPANFVAPFTVSFISAPVGFDPLVFNSSHPGPFLSAPTYYNPAVALPEGTYVVQVTDACGHSATQSVTIQNESAPSQISASIQMGCSEGYGGVLLVSFGSLIQSVTLISTTAPNYFEILPQNLNDYLSSNGIFVMNNLQAGVYSFQVVDACNTTQVISVNVFGYEIFSDNHHIIPGCNSFDLELHHSDNFLGSPYFWLQKLNPVTNEWGHPATGYSQGEIGPLNAVAVTNNAINYNLAYTGTFRVVKSFPLTANAYQGNYTCDKVIYQFDYFPQVRITSINAFSCSPSSSDIIVTAIGVAPLIYRITSKNGQPFSVDNANSGYFSGLEPAVYNFQVQDACGNIVNRVYDISVPVSLAITPNGLCDGQPGSLSVPALPFLQFEWWKGNNQAAILSTTNLLEFAAFNSLSDAGIYHLHISYPNTNSCVDRVLDFEISPALGTPQAGTGMSASYCGAQGSIDLFAMLSGAHDDFGTWAEANQSSQLSGNVFDSNAAGAGNYIFKYRVNGLCNTFDETTVNITINNVPDTPMAFLEQDVCSGEPLQLMATTVENAAYNWTGPNGFNSTEQNPIIANSSQLSNGVYTVHAVANGCESAASSVEVSVLQALPLTVNATCDGSAFILTAVPANGEPLPQDVIYSWTGPENFSASGNPINITGNP